MTHSKDRAALDDRAAETEEQGVTLTDVYRVAIDVMLQWVQSKQQADRFNKEKKVRCAHSCARGWQLEGLSRRVPRIETVDSSIGLLQGATTDGPKSAAEAVVRLPVCLDVHVRRR